MKTNILKREPVVVNPMFLHQDEKRVKLSGEWNFRLDPNDVGVQERWFEHPFVFLEQIQVPGCWQGQGFGSDETEMHKEFFTAIRPFRATYEGTGWYSKTFTVSEEWKGERIWLNFGGSNPTTEVWLNGEYLGKHHLPFVPFGFDVTELIDFEKENHVAVRISEEDRLLGMTYYYCGKWSGLYRDVELVATGGAYIDKFSVLPNGESGEVAVKATVGGTGENVQLSTTIYDGDNKLVSVTVDAEKEKAEFSVELLQFKPWTLDTPNLYRIEVELYANGRVSDCRVDRFGFLFLSTKGKHFLINGEPYYMRGTGDFGEDPKNGSPSTERDHWRKCLKALKDMGYNYVRCQSFVPVPEYFDAADEIGVLIQSEMGMLGPIAGNSMYHTYNMWPKPTPDFREDFRSQWNSVVMRDICHPSANIYCMGNELPRTYFPKTAWRCYNETKKLKPSSFVIWSDGGHRHEFPESLPADFINEGAEVDAICDKPVIQHEFMWWSSYPDVSLKEKYKNCAGRHFSADMAIEVAGKRGTAHILPQAAKNTQVLQFMEAKAKMENLRRDYPTIAGVCHFNAMDTGMSPQGLIDMFYEQKYVTPERWQMTNGDTVILSSLNFNDRILISNTEWTCDFFVSDYSHPAMKEPQFKWCMESENGVVAAGELTYDHGAYKAVPIGTVKATVPAVEKPQKVILKAALTEGDKVVVNEWDLWIFPDAISLPKEVCMSENGEFDSNAKVVVTPRFTEELVAYAKAGGTVIVLGSEGLVRPFNSVLHLEEGRYFFTRPASFPPYEELQSGTIIQDHPMFGDLPHESYADFLFYNMLGESPGLDLEPLGFNDCDPVIRMLHSYQVGRSMGCIVERTLGKGLVIVTSLDMNKKFPEATYLLSQMCQYAISGEWENCPEITEDSIEKIISGTNVDVEDEF